MLALPGVAWSLRSARGERELPMTEFLVDTFTTALEPDEILTEVRIPQPAGPSGGTYLKLERKVGDFATVAAAVHLSLSDGTIARAGIALTAVGPDEPAGRRTRRRASPAPNPPRRRSPRPGGWRPRRRPR